MLPFHFATLTDTDHKTQVRHKIDGCLVNADEKRRNDKFLIGVQPFVILILKGLEMSKLSSFRKDLMSPVALISF